MVTRKGLIPVGEQPDQPSLGKMRLHLILRQVRQTETGQCGVQSQGDVVE
jgi:hypothetical protein